VYPDLPECLVVSCAVLVCEAILGGYLRRYLRRTARAASGDEEPIPIRVIWPPSPLGFSQVLILKVVKVLCFDTLLQVLILKKLVVYRRCPRISAIYPWARDKM
jgi:hypothetical protein